VFNTPTFFEILVYHQAKKKIIQGIEEKHKNASIA
jgi:hypothetical protein